MPRPDKKYIKSDNPILTFLIQLKTQNLYPTGIGISGRANCNCLMYHVLDSTKTGKLNRDEYNYCNNANTDCGVWLAIDKTEVPALTSI